MPKMSRKRRPEWPFFLNDRNRIVCNALCRGCAHGCKQSFRAVVVLCPRYRSKRWKPPDGEQTPDRREGCRVSRHPPRDPMCKGEPI